MKKFQVIKCKTCNTVFAACIDQHADDEWKEECEKYLKEGNSIVETIESIGNVLDDKPLNPCCGKPAVVGVVMKITDDQIRAEATKDSNLAFGTINRESACYETGFEYGARWTISQMQPELTTLKRHDEQLRIWINTMTYEIKVLKTALKDTLEFSRDEQLSEWLFDQDYHTQVIIEEKTGCDSLPQPPKDINQ